VTSPSFPPRKPPFNILDPTQAINTPYRVQRAFDAAQAAAFVIAGYNLLTGLIVWWRHRPIPTWLGSDPRTLWLAHVAAALLAAALGLLIRRRLPDWAVWVVLAWAILELTRFVPGRLYGHGMPWPLAAFVFFLAIQGVRGVMGRRKLKMESA